MTPLDAQIKDVESQIEGRRDRIVQAASPGVSWADEARTATSERQKIRMTDLTAQCVPPRVRIRQPLEACLK